MYNKTAGHMPVSVLIVSLANSHYRIWELELREWMCKHWQNEWCTL